MSQSSAGVANFDRFWGQRKKVLVIRFGVLRWPSHWKLPRTENRRKLLSIDQHHIHHMMLNFTEKNENEFSGSVQMIWHVETFRACLNCKFRWESWIKWALLSVFQHTSKSCLFVKKIRKSRKRCWQNIGALPFSLSLQKPWKWAGKLTTCGPCSSFFKESLSVGPTVSIPSFFLFVKQALIVTTTIYSSFFKKFRVGCINFTFIYSPPLLFLLMLSFLFSYSVLWRVPCLN